MKEKRSLSMKAAVLFLTMCLLIGGAVGGTLAWLASSSETVTNSFTVGDISITLQEHPFTVIDSVNNIVSTTELDKTATPVKKIETYKVVPGGEQPKDPFIIVEKNSEESYLYVSIQNNMVINKTTIIDGEAIVGTDLNTNDWTAIGSNTDTTTGAVTTLYRYKDKVETISTAKDSDPIYVFNKVTYSSKITKENIDDLSGQTIVLNAYAHQASATQTVADDAAIAWANVTKINN